MAEWLASTYVCQMDLDSRNAHRLERIKKEAPADQLKEAIAKAYAATEDIHFENAYMRKDIGQRALKAL